MKQKMHLIILTMSVLLSAAPIAWGQSIKDVTINQIEPSSAPDQYGNKIQAYVTVLSDDQKSVQGLSISNFNALEDGNEVNIKDVSQTDDPMSVVLAIDTSGSMQAQDRLTGKTSMEGAKEAAVEFISMLGSEDRVALYSFDNDTNFKLDFTLDHEAAIEAVQGLSSKYMAATRLYDTILEAVQKAAEVPKGRRAVILLTDGKDEKGDGTCSIHSSNDVIDAATTKARGVPIYTMGVGPQVDDKELARIAGDTGGSSMLATTLSELPGFYRDVANQLKNQYMVEYISLSPSGEHSLVIKVTQDGNRGQDEMGFWSPPLPVLKAPTVTIISPDPADTIKDSVNINVDITPIEGVAKVRYYVNGALKGENTTPPLGEFKWDTKGLPSGLYLLRVEAVDSNGQIGPAEVTLSLVSTESEKIKASTGKKSEGKTVIPLSALIGLAIVVIAVILVICLFRKRQGKQKETPKTPPVTVTRVTKTVDRTEECKPDTEESSDEIDNEATTMDIRADLEPLAKLTVIQSHKLDLGATFKVTGTTEIGRGTGNDIRVPDKSVSRKHAVINNVSGKFYIRDLNSTYGTQVDEKKVTSTGVEIGNGAKVQLGSTTIMEFNILFPGKDTDEDDKTMIYGQV